MQVLDISSVVEDGVNNPFGGSPFPLTPGDVGILRSTILPSFGLHSGLSIAAYVASRATGRVELKDWLWPSAQVINAWWSAVGRVMYYSDITFNVAWNSLSWTEKMLLGGVTAWGLRLFYRIASRSIARGKDDPRYEGVKKQPGFWNKTFFTQFLPEAAFQTIITLPFTVPFRLLPATVSLRPESAGLLRALAVGLFSAGFTMEVLADVQLESHRQERADLCREGVWSIVRHPNYLGDTLVHLSFPLFCASGPFHPATLLGPLANYIFLRYVGGDKENETSQEKRYRAEDPHKFEQLQEWRRTKNSFWPGLSELKNPWTWIIVGTGVVGALVEETARVCFNAF